MLTFKKIDVWGQLILIFSCMVLSFYIKGSFFLWSYFFVGGWQVTSTILQKLIVGKFPQNIERTTYQWFVVVATVTAPFGGFIFLLFLAPVAAIWYLSISFRELRVWEARQLIQLK